VHDASLLKAQAFRDAYLTAEARVLDVGSMSHLAQDSYRPIFAGFDYVGLDIAEGPNVDVVPADPYSWTEIPSGSFDAVISGQTFEHNPFFWLTMAEMTRVLRPGGLAWVSAPSRGRVHRYPLDCWRFYPDAAAALTAYVGLELVESYVEPQRDRAVKGAMWGDFVMVARRPMECDEGRLAAITATRLPFPKPAGQEGPSIAAYEQAVATSTFSWRMSQARDVVYEWRQQFGRWRRTR
jgi:SAM-dependent methyltransferase